MSRGSYSRPRSTPSSVANQTETLSSWSVIWPGSNKEMVTNLMAKIGLYPEYYQRWPTGIGRITGTSKDVLA